MQKPERPETHAQPFRSLRTVAEFGFLWKVALSSLPLAIEVKWALPSQKVISVHCRQLKRFELEYHGLAYRLQDNPGFEGSLLYPSHGIDLMLTRHCLCCIISLAGK